MIENEKPWDKRLQTLLAGIVAVNIFPHIWDAPVWATCTGYIFVLWKLLYLNRGLALPRRPLLAVGALLASIATWLQFGTLFGTEPASALLTVLASLKLLETNRYRDAMLVIFVSYFLLMAHLLVSQSLLSTFFMGFDILFVTTLMFQLHKRDRRRSVRSFRPAMRMLGITLPVWILFFFVFPRFTAAFSEGSANKASTGFSENLDPGAIESLSDSDELAFRVSFKTTSMPAMEALYWRGQVLSVSEGLRWNKAELTDLSWMKDAESAPPPHFDYEVFLEPGFNRMLFVLDYVQKLRSGEWLATRGIKHAGGFIYSAGQDVQSRVSYSALSSLHAPEQRLSPRERALALRLPSGLSPRIKALAEGLARSSPGGNEKLGRRLLNYFGEQGFRYTHEPGRLHAQGGVAQLDEFLFEHKLGFCEHFAAAFATLMRVMNVPARVVIGFQGGRFNSFGNYLLVRHLDAHAWTEIWVDDENGRGHWLRMDPTEVVAPLRLRLSGDYNRLDPRDLLSGLTPDEISRKFEGSFNGVLSHASLAWDALQMKWNAFLLDYDLRYQLELLQRLGFENASTALLITVLVGVLAIGLSAFAAIFVWLFRRRAKRVDPTLLVWHSFCEALAHADLERGANEGPLDFSERAAKARPDAAERIREIAARYMNLRYGDLDANERQMRLSELRQSVRRLSLPPVSKAASSVESES